jgi:peptidoglycan/xylan/chitin deacetylase (PgdA/CDA1 family)
MSIRTALLYWARLLAAHGLYYVGLLQLWQRFALRRRAVVLMYHRILSPEEQRKSASHPAIIVKAATFAKQMDFLARRFAVLSPDEFASCIGSRTPFPDSSCLITFDDGWRDNFTNALPILRRHKLPALIFLPVNFIGGRRLFWREALTHLLVRVVRESNAAPARAAAFRRILAPAGLESIVDLRDASPMPAIIEALEDLKPLSDATGDGLLRSLAHELGVAPEELDGVDTFMDWEQVSIMSRDGVGFGGHGADHRILSHVPADVVRDEVRTSKRVIEERLRSIVATFSYPNGGWRPDVADEVRASGYRLAFTTEPGFVSCEDEPYTIRRFNIHEHSTDTMPMFLARIVGLL